MRQMADSTPKASYILEHFDLQHMHSQKYLRGTNGSLLTQAHLQVINAGALYS